MESAHPFGVRTSEALSRTLSGSHPRGSVICERPAFSVRWLLLRNEDLKGFLRMRNGRLILV